MRFAMRKYELLRDEHGDDVPCEYCGCHVATTESKHMGGDRKIRVCEVCYTTVIGNILAHPELYGETCTVALIVAQVGNLILGKLPKSDG
jgi:hypothetical protein